MRTLYNITTITKTNNHYKTETNSHNGQPVFDLFQLTDIATQHSEKIPTVIKFYNEFIVFRIEECELNERKTRT